MILRLLSFLLEQVVGVLALQLLPECQFLKDPPSFIKKVQRKTQFMRYLLKNQRQRLSRAGAATCDIKEEVNRKNLQIRI